MSERNEQIIEKLVTVTCPLEKIRYLASQEKTDASLERFNKWPIRKVDALTMETVLEISIESGLNAPGTWKQIIWYEIFVHATYLLLVSCRL